MFPAGSTTEPDSPPLGVPAVSGRPGLMAVIGASAGGVRALQHVLSELPPTFPGAVAVVLHLAPNRPSQLARVLGRDAALPVETARDGQALLAGHIYVAPPDRHLVLAERALRLVVGPNENGHRPAVDPLFRSAARTFGPQVVAIVLSGSLDDGRAGLREVKARGGRAVIQEPDDADYAGMPLAALDAVHPDLLTDAPAIGRWLADQPVIEAGSPVRGTAPPTIRPAATLLTCPDCHGPLYEVFDGDLSRFDCLIGHRWSMASLEAYQRGDVETALWAALRALEEQAVLNRRLAERSVQDHRTRATASFRAAADRAGQQAALIRGVVEAVAVEEPPSVRTGEPAH